MDRRRRSAGDLGRDGSRAGGGVREAHGRIDDVASLQGSVVAPVALVHLPGELRALLGDTVGGAPDVARRQAARSEGRRVGEEWCRQWRYRGAESQLTKKK